MRGREKGEDEEMGGILLEFDVSFQQFAYFIFSKLRHNNISR